MVYENLVTQKKRSKSLIGIEDNALGRNTIFSHLLFHLGAGGDGDEVLSVNSYSMQTKKMLIIC